MSVPGDDLKHTVLKKMEEKRELFQIDFFNLEEHHFRKRLEAAFKSVLKEERISLDEQRREELFSEIVSDLLGFGPIDKLLKDPTVSEVMVNGPHQVYVERKGALELTDINFKDSNHLMYVVEKIISPIGRRVTELEPYVDARLKDGSRVNIITAPVSSIGPILSIRKFSHRILDINDLIGLGSLSAQVADFLKACVQARLNVLICGGAGSGKSTLLNILASFAASTERIVVIEDIRELSFNHNHVLYLETRPPNIEGKAEITIRSLVRNSLHMRPDRIIVGEVRGAEVMDMIQAMNTGHEGSMTTLHANSSGEALERLELLALMGSVNMSSEVAKRQIINAFDLVIQMARLPDGSRKIGNISQVLKTKHYALEDIFAYDRDAAGLVMAGRAPIFYDRLKKKADYCNQEFEKQGAI